MEDAYDTASSTIGMLETAKIAYDTGRTDILQSLEGFDFDCDNEYEFAMEGLHEVCDFVGYNDTNTGDIQSMYFSSHAMMEYYRLCREYGRLTGIALKSNPYMQKAEEHVREQMSEPDCYYCDYFLQTKVNHDWASGVLFRYDCSYFCEFLALLSRLLYVFEFYDCEVQTLRFDVWKLKYGQKNNVLMLPLPREEQRRAA